MRIPFLSLMLLCKYLLLSYTMTSVLIFYSLSVKARKCF